MKKHYERPEIEAVELDCQVMAMLGSDTPPADDDEENFPSQDNPWENPFATQNP